MEANHRPFIGILSSRNENKIVTDMNYTNAVWAAGGFGVPLSYTEDSVRLAAYVEAMDGFLFSGGVDIDPVHYGEAKQFDSVQIDEWRDRFELAIFPLVMASGKPILGICRGIQVMNVALGGTLYQHMEGHRQTNPSDVREQIVHVTKDGMLAHIIGETEILTNSFHHQNIKDLAPELICEGMTDDGYIEALSLPAHKFFLGVQFHPECYHTKDDAPHAMKIFEAFTKACK